MDKLKKCSVEDLEKLLYDVQSWDFLSVKINDIYREVDIIKDTIHAHTNFTTTTSQQVRELEKICDGITHNAIVILRDFGINDEDDFDDMIDLIEKCLKEKLCGVLKKRMSNNLDACQNMEKYIDGYFEIYQKQIKKIELLDDIEYWILYLQKSELKPF